MHQDRSFPYAADAGWQAIELPYVGDELAMVFLVPDAGRFAEVEGLVSEGLFDEVVGALQPAEVNLGLPRFEFRTKASVADCSRRWACPPPSTPMPPTSPA